MEHKIKMLIIFLSLSISSVCEELKPVETWSYETKKITFDFSFPVKVDGLLIFSRGKHLTPKILIEHPGPNSHLVHIREFTIFKHQLPRNAEVNKSKLHFLPITVDLEGLFKTLNKVHKIDFGGYVWVVPIDDGSDKTNKGYGCAINYL